MIPSITPNKEPMFNESFGNIDLSSYSSRHLEKKREEDSNYISERRTRQGPRIELDKSNPVGPLNPKP